MKNIKTELINYSFIMSQKTLLTSKEVTIILHRLACQLIEKYPYRLVKVSNGKVIDEDTFFTSN